MEYDYALRYEGLSLPEGSWVEVVALAGSLEEAQAGYDLCLPTTIDNPYLRNLQIVYAPKIPWAVWSE
ncbi:hypothetical protein SEA_ACOLYTE_33 [Mycobacterium phage Acolyte]|nr:hypothetical protein SEA_ACOLYTE_33 [Mycobacterium phage Acolyte]